MAAAKIKKGDKVVVLSGKDKGRHGEVTKVDAEGRQGARLRHQRPRPPHQAERRRDPQGGIVRAEAPLHVSKVAIEDPKTGKPTRVRFEDARRQEGPGRGPVRGADQWLKPNTSPRMRARL